jgi:hypothetical protein
MNMKIIKTITSIILIFIMTTTLDAQTKAELEKAVLDLKSAMQDPTFEKLDNIVSNNLTYGHSSGTLESKKVFMENLLNGNSDFVNITLTDQEIWLHGNTAVVRHNLNSKTNDKGKAPGEVNLHIMTVWNYENNKWILMARQAVKILK